MHSREREPQRSATPCPDKYKSLTSENNSHLLDFCFLQFSPIVRGRPGSILLISVDSNKLAQLYNDKFVFRGLYTKFLLPKPLSQGFEPDSGRATSKIHSQDIPGIQQKC
jgi:hypothetical protein